MEIEASEGEVRYTLKISNFTTYKDLSHSFTSEFPLSMNGLRSLWRLTVTPYLSNNHSINSAVHCDVGISLQCLRCSIVHPNIKIYCCVTGRGQEHEQALHQVGDEWSGTLVSRVALSVFKLLENNQLVASLRFVIRGGDVWRNEDSLEELSGQLGELYNSETAADIDILTNDGVKIPAHSSVLLARCNLLHKLQTWKHEFSEETNASLTPKHKTRCYKSELKTTESPLSSTFGSCTSSGYQSNSPDSTHASLTSSLHPTPFKSSTTPSKHHFTPTKHQSTPDKQHITPSQKTTSKPGTPIRSPSNKLHNPKSSNTNSPQTLKHKYSTPLSHNNPNTRSPLVNKTTCITPQHNHISTKPPTPRSSSHKRPLTPSGTTPSKRQLPYSKSTPDKPTNSNTPSGRYRSVLDHEHDLLEKEIITPILGKPPNIRSSHSSHNPESRHENYTNSNSRNLKYRPFHDHENDPPEDEIKTSLLDKPFISQSTASYSSRSSPLLPQDASLGRSKGEREVRTVRVNMSASVTRQMLEWIYTGSSSELGRLARPLLVCGLRHGVGGLARACEYYMAATLTPTTAPDTLLLADKYGAKTLRENTLEYAVTKANEVTEQANWWSVAARAPMLMTEFSRRLAHHAAAQGT